MKDNKNEVTPLIINGELNMRKTKKKNKIKKDSLPKKSFGFSDIFLSIIGFILVIYGIYTIINKEDKKKSIEDNTVNSNIVENEKKEELNTDIIKNKLSFSKEELSNIYSPIDLNGMINKLDVTNLSNNAKMSLAMKFTTPHVVGDELYILEEELDNSIKMLFGKNINYQKEAFTLGNNIYTYNQETKRYYLMDNTKKLNLTYNQIDFSESEELNDKLVIREYIAYTELNGTKSWTLNNMLLNIIIDENNIKEQYKNLKCFEYEFIKNGDNYNLVTITIK